MHLLKIMSKSIMHDRHSRDTYEINSHIKPIYAALFAARTLPSLGSREKLKIQFCGF